MFWKEFIEKWGLTTPDRWEEQRGYVVTRQWDDAGVNEGVEYHVLDAETIAYRFVGDWFGVGRWEICPSVKFFDILSEDVRIWNIIRREKC